MEQRVFELEEIFSSVIHSHAPDLAASGEIPRRFTRLLSEQRRMAVWQSQLTSKENSENTIHAAKSLLDQAGLNFPLDSQPDPIQLLKQANSAWQNQNSDEALAKYLTAFIFDRKREETGLQLLNYLMVHLSATYKNKDQFDQRKRVLKSYLVLYPDNTWALTALLKASLDPYDALVFRELLLKYPTWSDKGRKAARELLGSISFQIEQDDAKHLYDLLMVAI